MNLFQKDQILKHIKVLEPQLTEAQEALQAHRRDVLKPAEKREPELEYQVRESSERLSRLAGQLHSDFVSEVRLEARDIKGGEMTLAQWLETLIEEQITDVPLEALAFMFKSGKLVTMYSFNHCPTTIEGAGGCQDFGVRMTKPLTIDQVIAMPVKPYNRYHYDNSLEQAYKRNLATFIGDNAPELGPEGAEKVSISSCGEKLFVWAKSIKDVLELKAAGWHVLPFETQRLNDCRWSYDKTGTTSDKRWYTELRVRPQARLALEQAQKAKAEPRN